LKRKTRNLVTLRRGGRKGGDLAVYFCGKGKGGEKDRGEKEIPIRKGGRGGPPSIRGKRNAPA